MEQLEKVTMWLFNQITILARSCVAFQEIDVQNKKAIVIFVPVPQLRAYQKIQTRLVRELEKKFSGKHVIFIAQVGYLDEVLYLRTFTISYVLVVAISLFRIILFPVVSYFGIV